MERWLSSVKFIAASTCLVALGSCRTAAPITSHIAEDSTRVTSSNQSIYGQCLGQGGELSLQGDKKQLAPAFLEEMQTCRTNDVIPADGLAELVGQGKIKNGDCEYQNGISCHFHSSMEFVFSNKLKDDSNAVGELHCIVPSKDPNRPTVYGAHIRCAQNSNVPLDNIRECSSDVLKIFANGRCKDGFRCCNNGTLTKPVGMQTAAEALLRPDFRICQDSYIDIDCRVLKGMHEHTANVKGLGEVFEGNFHPTVSH